MGTNTGDKLKADLLREIGYGGDLAAAEAALQDAGLTNPRKDRISIAKTEQVRAVIAAKFVLVCNRGDCQKKAQALDDGRPIVPASTPAACEMCGGSVVNQGLAEMIDACTKRGWNRLCIVGGSPATHTQIQQAVGKRLKLRLVDGTMARTKARAKADVEWADRVIIWGSTELAHKVSELYVGDNLIVVTRRSVQELAQEVIRAAAT